MVASVLCIYGLGSLEDYANMVCEVAKGQQFSRTSLAKLVDKLYERNDIALTRGRFGPAAMWLRVHRATFDEEAIRIEFFGDEIDLIARFYSLTGQTLEVHPVCLLSGKAVRDAAR